MVVGLWDSGDRPNRGQGIGTLVGSHTGLCKTSHSSWTAANQIQRSVLFPSLSVFLRLSSLAFSACGEGAFHKWP